MKAYLESYQLYLESLEQQQALKVIEGIDDPLKKTEWYNKVHNDCGTSNIIVPQVQTGGEEGA